MRTFFLWITLLELIGACQSLEIKDERQAEFTRNLASYEITIPKKVTSSGDFVSHVIHHRYPRDVNGNPGNGHDVEDNNVHYVIGLANEDVHVEMWPNHKLLGPGLVVERRGSSHNTLARSKLELLSDPQCFYRGKIRSHVNSTVALCTCHGLAGILRSHKGDYFIEPVKGHNLTDDPRHPHIVYRADALRDPRIKGNNPVHRTGPSQETRKVKNHNNVTEKNHSEETCGVGNTEEYKRAIMERKRWEWKRDRWKTDDVRNTSMHERRKLGDARTHLRKKRSISSERNVETLVVADKRMVEYYANENLQIYLLTVMNMVSALYRDASIGNAINIVIVRLVLLEDDSTEEDLVISHHADQTLKSFCRWQKDVNPKDETDPNHHDVAILLTRYNICSRMNEPCSTLGLAEVAGMCQPQRSCNVNEDTGLALAYTVAHEMGHNFGMNHDGPHNGCQAPFGERQHVMSPHLNSDTSPFVWSNCSRHEITKFLDRDWGSCLDDEPSEHDFQYPELPPGAMYNADHQCRLQYGPSASYCHGIEDVCLTLWCRLDSKCVTRLEPAAPGTQCGKNRWCFNGHCSLMDAERPESIDGEWGQWSSWSECSRTCGAGASQSGRHCDNPQPANGGRYCIGERKRYRVCNTESCPEGSISFRGQQCAKFNDVPYKQELHNWLPVSDPTTPCQLHCKPEGKFFSVMLADSVIDGTPCNPGTRDMCINGKCKPVACDWGIDSEATEDRCGICHGDGTQCTTIRKEFKQETGVGYIEAAEFPRGARNIRVDEFENATNYLAVRGENGQYLLNGNYFILVHPRTTLRSRNGLTRGYSHIFPLYLSRENP